MVSIRAIQETVFGDNIRWIPTRFQFADGLTKVEEKLCRTFAAWLQFPMAILAEHASNSSWEELYLAKQSS